MLQELQKRLKAEHDEIMETHRKSLTKLSEDLTALCRKELTTFGTVTSTAVQDLVQHLRSTLQTQITQSTQTLRRQARNQFIAAVTGWITGACMVALMLLILQMLFGWQGRMIPHAIRMEQNQDSIYIPLHQPGITMQTYQRNQYIVIRK
jgi:exonuclease VII large subunit